MRGLRGVPYGRLGSYKDTLDHVFNRFQLMIHTNCDAYSIDTVVIGAGCVGLAIARQLTLTRSDGVLVVEKNETFGQETSSRNSEVVHAGIYYPPGSNKARFCVEGKNKLYKYCDENNIPYSKCGKILVATTDQEVAALRDIRMAALQNGVDDLQIVTPADVGTRFGEHGVRCREALFSPSSGVVDSHGLMSSMVRDIQSNGGVLSYNTRVIGGRIHRESSGRDGVHILDMEDAKTGSVTKIACKNIINSAGLWARKVSLALLGESYTSTIPQISFVKGNYFVPTKRKDFEKLSRNHLVYPVPSNDGGLGVHATIDVHHQSLRFGPDVEWLDHIKDPDGLQYDVDPDRAGKFTCAIGNYYNLQGDELLEAAYAGIRPKAMSKATNTHDFVIDSHGIPGFIALYGIESPGLTSCLALAEYTALLWQNTLSRQ